MYPRYTKGIVCTTCVSAFICWLATTSYNYEPAWIILREFLMSSAQTCPKSRVIQKRPVDRPTFLRDCGLQVLSTDSTADSRNKLLYMNKKKMI